MPFDQDPDRHIKSKRTHAKKRESIDATQPFGRCPIRFL